jgi:hypothetical protein
MGEWKLSNDLLGKMAARRMARGETIQRPRVNIDDGTGVGLVTFGKDPETGEGIPDCLVDMERVRNAGEAL